MDRLITIGSKRRVRPITQTEISECGLACTAMVADFYGLEIDLAGLRSRFTPPTRGMNLSALIGCAEQLGLVTRALRLELEDLPALRAPAILHWSMNHFVVLERTKKDRAFIVDPAGRSQWMRFSEISRFFTGVAVELSPSNDFHPQRARHRLRLSQLWSNAPGLGAAAAKILLLSATAQALLLVLPYFSQLAVDRAIDQGSIATLNILAVSFVTIAFIFGVITYLRSQLLIATGGGMGFGLSANLARRMFRLPISWFNNRHVGDILARFQSLRPIRDDLTQDAVAGLIDGVFALVALAIMISYSAVVAAIPLIALIALGAFRLVLFRRQRDAKEFAIILAGKEQSSLIEMLQGVRALRLSGKARHRELRWRSKLVDALNAELREKNVANTQQTVQTTAGYVENILFLWVSFSQAISGHFTLGAVFALYVYKVQFSSAAASFLDKMSQVRMISLHLDRIADIALAEEDARFVQQQPPVRELVGNLELKDVRYRYSDFEPEVLRGVSLRVRAGEYLAITGPSGEGKSTLAQILLGLLEPTSGQVLVDGMPLAAFGYENYQNMAAAVLQEDTLFAGSIFENISLFDDSATPAEVRRCAEFADIHSDIVAMPMGYETLVGDMGAALSGGQKQRILLARALFQRPRILILDEGTSHLDGASEARVNAAISELGITRIIIAHREETIRSADRLTVLEKGVLRDQRKEATIAP